MRVRLIIWKCLTVAAALGIIAGSLGLPRGRCQSGSPSLLETLPAPRLAQPLQPPAIPTGVDGEPYVLPIDFLSALRLAQTANLDIVQAQVIIRQYQAQQQKANVLWVPNLVMGSEYIHHEGNIQKTEGNIEKVNRDSLWAGFGPQINVAFTDAIFTPLVARQRVAATQAGLRRVTNDTLLRVALAYFDVLLARRRVARVQQTLVILTDERVSANRANSKGLLPLIRDVVEVGGKAAFRADLERVRAEVIRRLDERRAAIQDLEVATAELARLLYIDARKPLWPTEDFRFPIPVPGEEWYHQPVDALVMAAMSFRPELVENQALVRAALTRVKQAQFRPWLPNLNVIYGWGDYGGGPDLNPQVIVPPTTKGGKATIVQEPGFEPSGRIRHFGTRTDLDAYLYWRFDNMGFGNLAEIKEQKALHQQAVLRQAYWENTIVAQVVQSHERLTGWWDRLQIARSSLFDEQGGPNGPVYRAMSLNFQRIKAGEGRPLEVIDSIRGVNDALQQYAEAVTGYERARFRLLVSLGLPPEAMLDPTLIPSPCDPPAPEEPPPPPDPATQALLSEELVPPNMNGRKPPPAGPCPVPPGPGAPGGPTR